MPVNPNQATDFAGDAALAGALWPAIIEWRSRQLPTDLGWRTRAIAAFEPSARRAGCPSNELGSAELLERRRLPIPQGMSRQVRA